MVVGKVAARLEDRTAEGYDYVEISRVAEFHALDAETTRGCCSTPANPATAMQIDRISTRRIYPHRRVPIRRIEQMPVIGRDHRVLDAGRCKPLQRARDVFDHPAHDPPRIGRPGVLARRIDLG